MRATLLPPPIPLLTSPPASSTKSPWPCCRCKPDTRSALLPPPPPREFRPAWVATVANIDWPSKPGLSSQRQIPEMDDILDKAQQLHRNARILPLRTTADAS